MIRRSPFGSARCLQAPCLQAPCLAAAVLVGGCPGDDQTGSSEPTSTTSATTTTTDPVGDESSGGQPFVHTPCDPSTRAGSFTVQLEDGYTQVEGQVFDAASPVQPTELAMEEGCRLLETENHFCDPPCGPTDVCAEEGSCTPRPVAVSVGAVTIEGLSAAVSMEPNVTNFYLDLDELPHPGFEAGDSVELTAQGGAGEPFQLIGFGSETFEVLQEEIPLGMDMPVSLQWTPPSSTSATRVHIDLDIGHHGGSPATIECEVEDDGSFEIPASQVNQLIEFGVAGFPAIRLTRRTVDSTTVDGRCVEFIVAPRSVDLAVAIDGIVSCSTNADCPDGETCQADLVCG